MGDVFDVAAFCESASDDTSSALCAIGDEVTSAKAGLDVFFLLFGVSQEQGAKGGRIV